MTTTAMPPLSAVARESYAGECKTQAMERLNDSDFARLYNDFDSYANLGNRLAGMRGLR